MHILIVAKHSTNSDTNLSAGRFHVIIRNFLFEKYNSNAKKANEIENKITIGEHSTCLLLVLGSFSPWDKIGMIKGSTLSPSFLTSSPSDRPATCNREIVYYEFCRLWLNKNGSTIFKCRPAAFQRMMMQEK